MADLDGKARAGRRHTPRRIEHARQRRLVGVRVEPEAAVRDTPDALHRRGLHHHHARARDGELHQMLQMPVRGAAVGRRVLAHGRDDDAVGELDGADRGEKRWGTVSILGWGKTREAWRQIVRSGGLLLLKKARSRLSPDGPDSVILAAPIISTAPCHGPGQLADRVPLRGR